MQPDRRFGQVEKVSRQRGGCEPGNQARQYIPGTGRGQPRHTSTISRGMNAGAAVRLRNYGIFPLQQNETTRARCRFPRNIEFGARSPRVPCQLP